MFSCCILAGAMSVGLPRKRPSTDTKHEDGDDGSMQDCGATASASSTPRLKPPPPPKRSRTPALLPETDETKDLTTAELQRLVLLEQLKLIRMQQRQINP